MDYPEYLIDGLFLHIKKPLLLDSTRRQYLSTMNAIRTRLGVGDIDFIEDTDTTIKELHDLFLAGEIKLLTLRAYLNTLIVFSRENITQKEYKYYRDKIPF